MISKNINKVISLSISVLMIAILFVGCSSNGGGSSSSQMSSVSNSQVSTNSSSLETIDFATLMTSFSGNQKSDNWDRTNVITADTVTTATIAVPNGQTTSVIMLKGDSGKLVAPATTTASASFTTDPAKNSYYASALLLKNGSTAQYSDGIFKFKMKLSGAQNGVWNSAVIFKDTAPQKILGDDSVTKALSIVTVGGDVQIQRNYMDTSGKLVKQEVVKETGVSISDGKYHYFIFGMQDESNSTNVKLWIDGNVVYSGIVEGVSGAGAVQVFNNSTPVNGTDNKPQITSSGTSSVSYSVITACGETYFGGYDDGPVVSNITMS
jgi:hypothetical protein